MDTKESEIVEEVKESTQRSRKESFNNNDDDDCLLVKKNIDERRDEAINDVLASLSGNASRYGWS